MPAPAPPTNVTATVNANDSIDISWDYDPTWFAFDGTDSSLGGWNEGLWYGSSSVDNFEIEINRDSSGYSDPSGGPSTVSYADGTTNYSANYNPNSDTAYDRQIGIDSSFEFRVRATNAEGSSSWVSSGTFYTDPIAPHDPNVNRPDPSIVEISWYVKTDIPDFLRVAYREDTGSGYGSWKNFDTISGGETHVSGTYATGNTVTATYDVGTSYQAGLALQSNARYQFRLTNFNNDSNGSRKNSSASYADYGNNGNVFFQDDFEDQDFAEWDVANGASIESGGWNDTGVSGPDSGSYWALLTNDIDNNNDKLQKNLGDLSNESNVIVKCAVAVGSMDAGNERTVIDWYDGSSWNELVGKNWEYNKQDWFEVTALVPDSWLSTDNRVRFGGRGGLGGGDYHCFDRVVISDILHEHTKPAAPSSVTVTDKAASETVDGTDSATLTTDWTVNALFNDFDNVEWKKTSASSWDGEWVGGPTYKIPENNNPRLEQGQKYDIRVKSVINQQRHGSRESRYYSNNSTYHEETTPLEAATSPSLSAASDTSLSASWTDKSPDEHGYRVYYREVGASSWTQFSDLASNTTSETITGLSQNTDYEFYVEAYTEHIGSNSATDSAYTYLNESRSTSSYTTQSTSSAIRVVDLLESVSSHSAAITSSSEPIISLLAEPLSSVHTIGSSSTRSGINMGTRTPNASCTGSASSSSLRVVDLLESVSSYASTSGGGSSRSGINYEGRESTDSYSTSKSSSSIRIIDLLEGVESHSEKISSFTYNERTSLELIDHEVIWDNSKAVWYTEWFQESRILGSEDTLAIRSLVVENSKDPAAKVCFQYDKDGNGIVNDESDVVKLGRDQNVKNFTGVPVDEEGYYRIKIMEYSGYNSLYALDTAIIH